MRKLLMGLLLAVPACRSSTTVVPATASAPTASVNGARPALDAFLGAVRAQDLQAMSVAWGDKDGPVRDSKVMSRDDMEKRELVLMRCFRHDRYRVVSESPAANGERLLEVELWRGTLSRTTRFFTTAGPDRWYVRSGELEPLGDFCRARS